MVKGTITFLTLLADVPHLLQHPPQLVISVMKIYQMVVFFLLFLSFGIEGEGCLLMVVNVLAGWMDLCFDSLKLILECTLEVFISDVGILNALILALKFEEKTGLK